MPSQAVPFQIYTILCVVSINICPSWPAVVGLAVPELQVQTWKWVDVPLLLAVIYEPEFPVYILVPAIERVPVLLIVTALAVPLILIFVPAVIVFLATVTAWPLTVTPPTTVASAAAALPPLKLGELKVI